MAFRQLAYFAEFLLLETENYTPIYFAMKMAGAQQFKSWILY